MFSNEFFKLGALALAPDQKAIPFSLEAFSEAARMTLMGMGMIFAVLGVLWGVLMVFKLVFARPKKEKKAEAPKVEPATADIVESEPAPAATDDAELIAILTAAIYAYEAEQNPDAQVGNFRVVSYRRANGGRSWNAK